MSHPLRQPHVVLDLASRRLKAMKIARVLELKPDAAPIAMLEVGTGSGGIAHYFATHPGMDCRVTSVDVVDSRVVSDGYQFVPVQGVGLPFSDASFDVVISNHVIEHVGESEAQCLHLRELWRTLRPGGRGYLAVPNRWMVVEPHYRLAFLSWWPRAWRSGYLRRMRGIGFYDCEPLAMGPLESMLAATGWQFRNACAEAAVVMEDVEPGNRGLAVYNALPPLFKRLTLAAMPTLIYRLDKPIG